MSSCKNRNVVLDTNGSPWDLGNPNILAVLPDTATPPGAQIITYAGGLFGISSTPPLHMSFADAKAAFEAS
jgi:hypothetical protein